MCKNQVLLEDKQVTFDDTKAIIDNGCEDKIRSIISYFEITLHRRVDNLPARAISLIDSYTNVIRSKSLYIHLHRECMKNFN